MSTAPAKITLEEAYESLKWTDEMAIERTFGFDIHQIIETKQVTATRALVFVQKRREGLSDKEAKATAVEMTLRESMDFFAPAVDIDPENPETPQGEAFDA